MFGLWATSWKRLGTTGLYFCIAYINKIYFLLIIINGPPTMTIMAHRLKTAEIGLLVPNRMKATTCAHLEKMFVR